MRKGGRQINCPGIVGGNTVQLLLDASLQVRKRVGMETAPLLPYAVDNVACGGSVAGDQRKNNNKGTKKTLRFLSDQEDVLRDGWSVELEAVQAQEWRTPPRSGCRLVPRV
ncbi:hypothetical protein VZT92_010200 [Zoarces viviparus]|uniref:Uncharacterized protein n=1 Tax=Zoarces viviparus TaxID=48416 RepID=A0AAW1FF50_ZOAVI